GHAVEGTQLEPLVDRRAVLAGRGRELTGELDRPFGALHVDDHPAGDEVLGLGERPVGDRWPSLPAVAHPEALGCQGLGVDVLEIGRASCRGRGYIGVVWR